MRVHSVPRRARPLLLFLLLGGSASLSQENAAERGVVRGEVLLKGDPPVEEPVEVDGNTLGVCGHEALHVRQEWVVGKNRGLANCVVTLRPVGEATVAAKPLDEACLKKVGCRYEPRILIVTAGTKVRFRNVNAPCLGFHLLPLMKPETYYLRQWVATGSEKEKVLPDLGIYRVRCDNRPTMIAYVAVVDTPYFACTDAAGSFEIRDLPPGDYDVTVWHEKAGPLGKEEGPTRISVKSAGSERIRYSVPSPANRDSR